MGRELKILAIFVLFAFVGVSEATTLDVCSERHRVLFVDKSRSALFVSLLEEGDNLRLKVTLEHGLSWSFPLAESAKTFRGFHTTSYGLRHAHLTPLSDGFALYGAGQMGEKLVLYRWSLDTPEQLKEYPISKILPKFDSGLIFDKTKGYWIINHGQVFRQGNYWTLPTVLPRGYFLIDLVVPGPTFSVSVIEADNLVGLRVEEDKRISVEMRRRNVSKILYAGESIIGTLPGRASILPIERHPVTGDDFSGLAIVQKESWKQPGRAGLRARSTISGTISTSGSIGEYVEFEREFTHLSFEYDHINKEILWFKSSNDGIVEQLFFPVRKDLGDAIQGLIETGVDNIHFAASTPDYSRVALSTSVGSVFLERGSAEAAYTTMIVCPENELLKGK